MRDPVDDPLHQLEPRPVAAVTDAGDTDTTNKALLQDTVFFKKKHLFLSVLAPYPH